MPLHSKLFIRELRKYSRHFGKLANQSSMQTSVAFPVAYSLRVARCNFLLHPKKKVTTTRRKRTLADFTKEPIYGTDAPMLYKTKITKDVQAEISTFG